MSKVVMWYCKHLTRKIEKYHDMVRKFLLYVFKVKTWIKRDTEILNKYLKMLSKEENLKYGKDMGYISEADYVVMLQGGERPMSLTCPKCNKPMKCLSGSSVYVCQVCKSSFDLLNEENATI